MFDGIPDETREFLIRLLLVVLVCVALVLLRRALMWLLTKPLQRLLEPLGLAGSDEAIRSILTRPVRYVLLASALYLSALILNISPSLTAFALHISRTLVIAAFGFAAFRLIEVLVQSRQQFYNLTKVSVDEALLPFLRVSSQIIVVVMAVLITMQEWGFDVTGLIAGWELALWRFRSARRRRFQTCLASLRWSVTDRSLSERRSGYRMLRGMSKNWECARP